MSDFLFCQFRHIWVRVCTHMHAHIYTQRQYSNSAIVEYTNYSNVNRGKLQVQVSMLSSGL